jgi:AcrR family transcriptional regulator
MQPGEDETAPRRGRPRSFDYDEAARAALGVLWAQGYESASIDELGRAAGLSTSSLYAAFGSKRGVLDAALDAYERLMDEALGVLDRGDRGVDDVLAFLAKVAPAVRGDSTPHGCFMVNTMTEMAPRDRDIARRTERYRGRILEGLTAALERASRAGEIEVRTARQRARLVQTGLFGALVMARAGAHVDAAASLRALEREVRRWREPTGRARVTRGGPKSGR